MIYVSERVMVIRDLL